MGKIALVGTNFYIREQTGKDIDVFSLMDKTSLLDYDIVIIGINDNIIVDYEGLSAKKFDGYPLISQNNSAEFIQNLKRRKNEIKSLLASGRNVFYLLGDESKCYYHTYKKEYSGTGKNQQTTNYVANMDIAKYLIDKDINVTYSSGTNINIIQNTKLTEFANKTSRYMYYSAYFEDKNFESTITTTSKSNLISGIQKQENAYKVILPEFVDRSLYNSKQQKQRLQDIGMVIGCIEELDENLKGKTDIPDWINEYAICNEYEYIKENEILEAQIKCLREKQENINKALDNNFKYKKLLYSTGKELENIVKDVFTEMGFNLLNSRPNRSDVNLQNGDRYFVCEVKGVSKSASEKNASQLQKWETEFYEDFDIHPKQILIVNTYRNIPLFDRIDEDFPNQMLPYCIKKEQCLITTAQLLCVYLDWQKNPSMINSFLDELVETNGLYNNYNDIDKYINLKENIIDCTESLKETIKS